MLATQAQQTLASLTDDLRRIDQRLTQITQSLTSLQFAPDSDEPVNLEAAIYSALVNAQEDELRTLIRVLDSASQLSIQDLGPAKSGSPPAEVIFGRQTTQPSQQLFT